MIMGINHITLAVHDIDRSFAFYHDILDFKPLCKWQGSAYFLVGNLWFCLDHDTIRQPQADSTHYAFSVLPQDFEAMCKRIHASGALIYKENESSGKSLYFLDPDGHRLEIHTGNWQERIMAKKIQPGKWADIQWYV